jgi:uncharacterized membrane protein YbhN (UPF0104 family)
MAASAVGLMVLVYHVGAGSITAALASLAWWQFALVCAVHALSLVTDTLGWRYAFAADRPTFRGLLVAKCAGEAVNVLTALGSVGGEAVKAWALRRETPYEASVPSLVLAKTSLVVAQALLLLVGVLVAWAAGLGGTVLFTAMLSLLAVEVLAVGGFLGVQLAGVVGRAGRLLAWAGWSPEQAQRLDGALRAFYREHRASFAASVAWHFAGWLIGALEALVILRSLALPATAATALVLEALGSGVRFATFVVPASLGTLEGANAAAFTAFGWAAAAGLAFTLVRRGRQAVWIGLGIAVLAMLGAARSLAPSEAGPAAAGADRTAPGLPPPAEGDRRGRRRGPGSPRLAPRPD